MNEESEIEKIMLNISKYYQYSQTLHHYTNLIAQTTNAKDKIAYYICLDGFATRLSNYCLSIYDEILNQDLDFQKANSNRIYLRGCLESCLIINILLSRPQLTQNFMNNLTYDVVRINNVYANSSKSRFFLYREFYNITLEGKPQKRFGWLPRYKGKKALNMSDLLNYISFENEDKRNYYEMLIRSADNFSHPSFYIPRAVLDKNKTNKHKELDILTNKSGILYECVHIINHFIKEFLNPRVAQVLNEIINNECLESTNKVSFIDVNDYILGANSTLNHCDIANFFKKRINIEKKIKLRNNVYPHQINSISNKLLTLGKTTLRTKDSFLHRNIGLLLLDARLRIDELFKAYYDFDLLSFYTQVRYVIEFVVTINILLNEDNERNKIYYIHQYIKGYQARNTIKNFVFKHSKIIAEQLNNITDNDYEQYQKSIDLIVDYYKNVHNKEVDRNNAVRLNAWALYLKGLDNEYVLNLPSLLSFSVSNLMENVNKELDQYNLNINITKYILGLYEESCAYSHVTPYAWVNNIKLYKNRNSFREQFLFVLLLLLEIYKEIDESLIENEKTVQKDLIEKISEEIFEYSEEIIVPFLNEYINENKKQ